MTSISLWQPWATLWLLTHPDEKVFETRSWSTLVRGTVLIHAAKKRDGEVREALACPHFRERLEAHGLTPETLAFGALIGSVQLIGCSRMGTRWLGEWPSDREMRAGNWSPERFAWERGPVTRIFERPIPYKGKQGFFEVPRAVITEDLV